ncbi:MULTISPECIES: NADH-quinone oxidoreductase subunit J [Myroides]|uniref:NADH-quinone oxidoreductase subunit J n=1 Tax=Myroides albus TaxID=2562892 RepID=A0A6I3LHT2_9FLAO|nr:MULTISPECIES: NADH-quinone oxidoreductase subunit J [Myroides]MTG96710.1 NADH-quinone oxidoreductase subunit J [Myroides albus]MVX35648.1 NADH-quinone oxidoreductase subunit J [Myroides sp. LoEW2-1]UVD80878.1 NADH-quinone oxidoreductase subunit J [Myroides albus]
MIEILFYILSTITLGSAALTVLSKNPIHSALWLVVSFFSLAGHYILLNSQFLGMVHIMVYSGAIMILMLFTIMLMNLNISHEVSKPFITKLVATVAFCLIGILMLSIVMRGAQTYDLQYATSGQDFQSAHVLGKILLNEYVMPFEMVAVLLLLAMIGAVLISKKDKTEKGA